MPTATHSNLVAFLLLAMFTYATIWGVGVAIDGRRSLRSLFWLVTVESLLAAVFSVFIRV